MGYVAKTCDIVKSKSHEYTILDELNKGGFADAYKAKDENGKIVFLKQYKSPSKLVPWFKSYFKYEEELNRRLREDPVLKSASVYSEELFLAKVHKPDGYSLWTRNDCIFQVFPFITGNTNLADIISNKSFSWDKRVYASAVFAFAMRKLHDINIVHCDLKPENVQIKLDSSIALKYRPLLIDMDWSILSDKKAPWHGYQGYVGTAGYTSPEHLKNEAPLEASDVFTTAIILCQVLADAHPFASKLSSEKLSEYILSGKNDFGSKDKIPFKGDVSDKFRELVFNALNVDPKKRPTMVEIHSELMDMCKQLGKPKKAIAEEIKDTAIEAKTGIGAAIKSFFTRKPVATEPEPTPAPKPIASPRPRAISRTTVIADSGITLSGDAGTFTTKSNFTFDRFILGKVSTQAKFADNDNQFKVMNKKGKWMIVSNPAAVNFTAVNGNALEDDSPVELKLNDVIALKGKASGKIAMQIKVEL